MKLLRARFQNFRLLRDLELDFSTDREKKLTVVRAENESGKTTVLNALQWGLYGEDGLPGQGKNYPISPIGGEISDYEIFPISVEIDFEITHIRKSRMGQLIETTEQYRLIRSTKEVLHGVEHNRSKPEVNLLRSTDQGWEAVEHPDAFIRETLPLELREVFFTDGDRALSFIETESLYDKRKLVKEAIQSLLGLKVIEKSLDHIKKTASKTNKDVKKIIPDEELKKAITEKEQLDEEVEDFEKKRDDANNQFAIFDQKCNKIDEEIKDALRKGNRDELVRNIEQVKSEIKAIDNQRSEAAKEHSKLFKSLVLSRDLLAPVLEKSIGELKILRDQGKLPNATIPVLEERLLAEICICGESLNPQKSTDKNRRDQIQHLIKESRKVDKFQSTLTELYFASRDLQPKKDVDGDSWCNYYAKTAERRDELEIRRKELGEKRKSLDAQLDAIPNTDIHGLRATEKDFIAQRARFSDARSKYEIQLKNAKEKRDSLNATLRNLETEQRRGKRVLTKLEVTEDIKQVLQNSFDRITDEELNKVSLLMNKLFLKMIRADPEQYSIIQRTEISQEFDILVYGLNNAPLNTIDGINGASRRALTLAFIFALTSVSEVEAPNVIDTPLGMMSGDVKESVLETTIDESSQLILFLTRSEITDCEDILDVGAGKVFTLTNSAHYPEMLLNDPKVETPRIMLCECNHRENCNCCVRKRDIDPK